jgi:cyclin-C
MASNYWESSQLKYWTFSKARLAEIRRKLEEEDKAMVQQFPLPDRRLLNIYFSQQLGKLGKRMSVRQQALATAQIYIKRFFTKVEMRRTNPYLLISTAFYLACKMEECPQHIRLVVGEARQFWPDSISSDTSKLGECEFHLISELSSQLIVHHPYRSLGDLSSTFSLTTEETALAWSIINDHYLTDLPLLHPPHVIAITAGFLAVVLKPSQGASMTGVSAQSVSNAMNALNSGQGPSGGQGARVQKLVNWLAESSVSVEAVVDCVQELISLYELWEQFNEKLCKEQLSRFVKARGLDK